MSQLFGQQTKCGLVVVWQVFMIPGAMFINVLAGSLYGLWGTFCVIACISTLGACLNYWLARLLVRVMFTFSVFQNLWSDITQPLVL